MAELPPSTPKTLGSRLLNLLVQFGTQSSAESATKTRRSAAQPTPSPARIDQSVVSSTDSLSQALSEELKMEKRRYERERSGGLRRSARERKSMILESDTIAVTSTAAQIPPKLDTARTRLRKDIADKSKAKANNFLVANKDYFLPLLPRNNYISKLVAKNQSGSIIEYTELSQQPEGVTAVMKPYQLSGLSFLVHLYNNGFSGILGDEMGLGKTLQTLSLFQYLEELDSENGVTSEELRPYLVVCPLSVLNSWVTEAKRWVPDLRVMRFHGNIAERQRLKRVALGMEDMKGIETATAKDRKASRKAGQKVGRFAPNDHKSTAPQIIVTTYDTFQAEQSWFKHSFVWRYVVLDEGHKIKSSVTQISNSLKNISAEYRLILTGTPLQNNMVEMWSLLAWLYPDVFIDGTDKLFKDSFDLNKGKADTTTMDNARRLLELVMLRRMKDSPSVNLGLPPKEEVLLYVPLTPLQKFWYTRILTRIDDGMLQELFADGKEKEKMAIKQDLQENALLHQLEKAEKQVALADQQNDDWEESANLIRETLAKEQGDGSTKGAWHKLMNLVMQLRKVCSHPYLLPGAAPEPYYFGDHIIRASGKFILLEKSLKHTIFEQGKKVLIFSGFTRTLDLCEDLLALISNRGERFRTLRLDGSTARARRNLDIRLFNTPESDYKVMLLSTRAGGLGINLTSAQDVIFLDEDWNPQITLQAEARAHRIGQTKKVTIYKLCTQGTVEEQMIGRIRKKLYLSAKITESMQSIHDKQTSVGLKSNGRPSISDEMPQLGTSQLKTLVRRGAQTLSHPEIDVKEMVSWDLQTMMEKCRDKPTDLSAVEASNSEHDEEKWLSVVERVECAVFDGKRYHRQLNQNSKSKTSTANILPDHITRGDRRKGKNTTVVVNGYAINKESMNCADWEAVPTMAGKDPRLAEPVREKKREYSHEQHCLDCFEGEEMGHMVACRSCPRAYHFDCLDVDYQAKVRGFRGFFCSQHNCTECGKSTADSGGLIFRCRWCPQGFCEDCLDWDLTELVGETLPEFEVMDEGPMSGGFYIKCPTCLELCQENEEQREWAYKMEAFYKQQYDVWRKGQGLADAEACGAPPQDAAKNLDVEKAALSLRGLSQPTRSPVERHHIIIDDEDDMASLPALTDTSLPTLSARSSRIGTPKAVETPLNIKTAKKKRSAEKEISDTRKGKKARLITHT